MHEDHIAVAVTALRLSSGSELQHIVYPPDRLAVGSVITLALF